MAVGRSEGPQRKKQGDPHRQPERLFPDRVQLFGHRRAIDREWICSGMLDAGQVRGRGFHFQPAWNNQVGKKVNIVGEHHLGSDAAVSTIL